MPLDKTYARIAKSKEHSIYLKGAILLASGWFFQGLLYMDSTEKWFKIFLDVVMIIVISFFLVFFIPSLIIAILISFIIAHTMNFLFNGQLMVIMKNLGKSKMSPELFSSFQSYIDGILKKNRDSIISAAFIGSIVRNEWSLSSDLDMRVIRKKGFMPAIRACRLAMHLRTRALLSRFPLDIYIFDSVDSMSRLSSLEKPLIIFDTEGSLEKYYQRTKLK